MILAFRATGFWLAAQVRFFSEWRQKPNRSPKKYLSHNSEKIWDNADMTLNKAVF